VVYLIVLLLLIGLGLLWLARRRQVATGLPPGRVISIDTEHLDHFERSLYDPTLNLAGRPDYLVETLGRLVPVEVKSARAPFGPHPSHVLQLAAYCALVHAAYGKRPAYGIVKYADRAFSVDYDSSLENELLDLLAEMRRAERQKPDRSHESVNRCQACGFHQVCDQMLE
jgi:CRISPR-associated exonuclease Cas4